MHGQNHIKSV